VQLATASRHLDVLLRADHRAWFSSKLHSGPQPPRVTPSRSVAYCPARRCVAALDRPAACRASRLVQLKAARRPTAASRHSTLKRRALRSSPLRLETWTSCCVQSVAPGSAQSCTAAHSLLASLHLGASRAAQLAAASWPLATPLREERRAKFRQSVATGSAQSCTAAHSRHASLHLGASRTAQLAAASRPLIILLREERRAKFSSKLHGGLQPPRVAPPQSVACCAARRCVAGLGRPAACIASRLVQLKAARRPTAASRLSTSERRALRTSQHRRGIWMSRYVQSVAPSSAQSCMSAHSRLASLHFGASRLVQLATASRHLDVLLRA